MNNNSLNIHDQPAMLVYDLEDTKAQGALDDTSMLSRLTDCNLCGTVPQVFRYDAMDNTTTTQSETLTDKKIRFSSDVASREIPSRYDLEVGQKEEIWYTGPQLK